MRVRKSRGEWSAIIRAFERSGESHEEFCSRRGLKIGTFRSALYRQRRAVGGAEEVALVPVEVVDCLSEAVANKTEPAELVIAVAGVEVHIGVGTDIGYVGALVAELRARC